MEYIFTDIDREIIQDIKTESDAELNKNINSYIAVVARQTRMAPGGYTLILDQVTGLPVKMVSMPEGKQ